MEDRERPTDVEALAVPGGARGPCVDLQTQRFVLKGERASRVSRRDGWCHDMRQQAAVRPSDLELAIDSVRDVVALFVNRAMVPPAEQDEVSQCGRPAMSPMLDVVSLA